MPDPNAVGACRRPARPGLGVLTLQKNRPVRDWKVALPLFTVHFPHFR